MQENIIKIKKGQTLDRNEFLRQLVDALYVRNDIELQRGNFRVKGETVDIYMAYSDNVLRVTWWDDEIDSIEESIPSPIIVWNPLIPTRFIQPIFS